ncbi:MAG TPA: hypothetical protein VN673_12045 [Clostridia bacterium]|nr:hypothetical protein [Clostridia bacterium]
MNRVAIIVACALAPLVVAASILLWLGFHVPYPPQPKIGFTGNWRTTDVFGFKERPLPPASEVWQDYGSWTVPTNFHGSRLYLARLGGATRQSGFRPSFSSGDTPAGAQRYTHVEFTYTDPTNGTYILDWYLRGKHGTEFLRFNDTFRLYQLQPHGRPGELPPRLSIVGIEGVRPEHYVSP